jgi:hypothetical protein
MAGLLFLFCDKLVTYSDHTTSGDHKACLLGQSLLYSLRILLSARRRRRCCTIPNKAAEATRTSHIVAQGNDLPS